MTRAAPLRAAPLHTFFAKCSVANNVFLFADDTTLLYADKNLRSLEATVNKEFANVCNWLMANKLSLNTKKSNFVIFKPY